MPEHKSTRLLREFIRGAFDVGPDLNARWTPSPRVDLAPDEDDEDDDAEELQRETRRRGRGLRQTDSAGPGVTTDPTAAGVPYGDSEIQRGTDIYSYWYRSPGDKSTGGNFRPDDPEEYIGFKTKGARPDDAAADLAPKPIAAESDEVEAEAHVDGEDSDVEEAGLLRPSGC